MDEYIPFCRMVAAKSKEEEGMLTTIHEVERTTSGVITGQELSLVTEGKILHKGQGIIFYRNLIELENCVL